MAALPSVPEYVFPPLQDKTMELPFHLLPIPGTALSTVLLYSDNSVPHQTDSDSYLCPDTACFYSGSLTKRYSSLLFLLLLTKQKLWYLSDLSLRLSSPIFSHFLTDGILPGYSSVRTSHPLESLPEMSYPMSVLRQTKHH